jgi:hypothetical protein
VSKTPVPIVEVLKKASEGLLFISETEAPLEPFSWSAGETLDHKRLLVLTKSAANTAVEEMTLDGFFRAVPPEDRAKFQPLLKVLKEQLTGAKVYKLGAEAKKQVYIVGKTLDGQWAGLKTKVVES